MVRRLAAVGGLGLAVAAFACTDLSGLSGGPAADAGPEGSVSDAGADAADGGQRCPATAIFCDGFESAGFAAFTDSEITDGGTFAIEDRVVHAGMYAARSSTLAPDASSALYVSALRRRSFVTPITKGTVAVRAYVQVPRPLEDAVSSIVRLKAKSGAEVEVGVRPSGPFTVDVDGLDAGRQETPAVVGPTLGKWHCLELQVTLGASGNLTLLLDGQKIVDLPEDIAVSDGLSSLELGFSYVRTTNDVLFDDVVVATAPIGCE